MRKLIVFGALLALAAAATGGGKKSSGASDGNNDRGLLSGVFSGFSNRGKMRAVVDDYVREVVEEAKGVRVIYTDGVFDDDIRREAKRRGVELEPVSIMSRNGALALAMAVERGDDVALQVGFVLWKNKGRELPPCSGVLARTGKMPEEDSQRGVDAARCLGERILELYRKDAVSFGLGKDLKKRFLAVQWRIARLAIMRAERADHAGQAELAQKDKTLADELDNNNAALQDLRKGLDQAEALTMRVITPRRGLMMALDQADLPQARRYAELILKNEPDNTHANFAMGMSYYIQKQWARAEEYFRRYLMTKEDAAVLNNLAIVCMETDRYDEALPLAEKALTLLPNSGEVKETISDIKKRQAEAAKKAAEAQKKAGNVGAAPQPPAADTAVTPSSPEPAATNVPPPAAKKTPADEKKPAPAPAAEKPAAAPVLRMAPSPREELDAAIARGDYVAAAQYAKPILSITPDDPYANFAVGMDHFGKRAWEPAERHLRKCVKQKPDEPVFLNNLAVVLLYRGRYDDALAQARRALKILPDSKDVQDTIRQIEKARDADGAKKPETKPAPKKKSEAKPPAKKKPEAKKPEVKKPEAKKPAEKPAKAPENPPEGDGPDALVPSLPAAPETM